MSIKELLLEYKKLRNMTDLQWRQYCLRYATRNASTVEWALFTLFGTLPNDAEPLIRAEMQAFLAGL